MDMRLEHTAIQLETPCGVCRSQFAAEGEVTIPGSLRETTNVLHASAMAVVESAEAAQDRINVRGRVIFCVIYTQGESAKADAIEATADFTHLCDLPGAVPRAEVTAYAQVEHVEARVLNGRMSLRAIVHLCARAMAGDTAEVIARVDSAAAQQRMQTVKLRRTAARGSGDTLLREEFSLPPDLAIQDTLGAWASIRLNDATGGQGRIGLSGEVTLEALHTTGIPGKPLVMTRHTVPVAESVEIAGEGGELLDGRAQIKDVAVASQDMGDGERILRAEVLLGLSAWADREETVEVLADGYTTGGDALRLTRERRRIRIGDSRTQAAESGKASILLPEGAKPLRNILAAFTVPVMTGHTQQGSRLVAEGVLETTLVYMSDGEVPVSAHAEAPFRTAFAASASPDALITLSAVNVEAVPVTSDRAELRYIMQAEVDGVQTDTVSLVTEAAAVPAEPVTEDIVLYFTQPDETAWDIARRYRIPESELRVLNPELSGDPKPGQGVVVWRRNAQ